MDGTVIQQGRFTSTGAAVDLNLRMNPDWVRVYNLTVLGAAGNDVAAEFFWMRGIQNGSGIRYVKTSTTNALAASVANIGLGITLTDTSESNLGAINATVTAISNAAIPVVSASSTSGLGEGSVVRFVNVAGAQQFGGIDFEIDTVVTDTSFKLPYAPQIVAGTTGSFYPVKYDPNFYPRRRFISKITKASAAVITTTVSHGLTAGQKFRINVPASFDMTQIDGLVATAVSVTASTITTDIDSLAFTTFAWPLTADVPFTPATITPLGMAATSTYQNSLDDATQDLGKIILTLAGGAQSPAGVTSDIIYWQAGVSFSVDNQ